MRDFVEKVPTFNEFQLVLPCLASDQRCWQIEACSSQEPHAYGKHIEAGHGIRR